MPWVGYSRLIICPLPHLSSLGFLSSQHNLCHLNHLTKQYTPQSHDLCLPLHTAPCSSCWSLEWLLLYCILCYPFCLGEEILCAPIKYMSNLITETHFGDLFSETSLGSIYYIFQIPHSKQMAYSEGITRVYYEGTLTRVWAKLLPTRNGKAPD